MSPTELRARREHPRVPSEPAVRPQAGYAAGMDAADETVLALYEAEGALLYRLALRITGSREDARDAVQESFARLVEQRERLKALQRPEAWLRTVLTRVAIDLRRKRFQRMEVQREGWLETLPIEDPLVSTKTRGELLNDADALPALCAALEELSALDRAIVLRRALDGTPLEEIARALGLSEKAVRNRLSRARGYLKTLLSKSGPDA